MPLPVQLSIGMVSIYGQGSINDLLATSNNSKLKFGTVNQMYSQYGQVSIGQSVMYSAEDIIQTVYYNPDIYYIVPEDKITAIENPIISPP